MILFKDYLKEAKIDVRKYTIKLLDMVDDEAIDAKQVVKMCLNYMSEDDVKDMMEMNDVI